MLEVNARSFEGKEAVYTRDRAEGNIYELKKELEEKQMLLSGMHGEKVHQENKAIKLEE